jgi:hypothetical protein
MTLSRRIAVTLTFTAALVLAAPTAALANEPTEAEYGQHARHCAQTMGFTGEHNPGVHHGFTGWDGMSCEH